jgi:hypothetical protein
MMRTLVYIGEDFAEQGYPFVKPFQEKETEQQFSWEQAIYLMSTEGITIRPPEPAELESVRAGVNLIKACSAFLAQFMEPVQEGA